MTDPVKEPTKAPSKKSGGANRKTAVIAGLACVGVVAAIIAMNLDGPAIGSDAPAPTPNAAPVIVSVTPATERIEPLDVCQLVCDATDGDGDALTYTWTASQGEIIGEGSTIDWGAPNTEGRFGVSVTVNDGNGGTDEYSVSLRVKDNYAPVFQSTTTFGEGVRPGASVSISCPASDANGDDLVYEWHSAYGEVQGEGPSIVWIAPRELGSYVVTVSARDAYGGEVQRDVLISVTPSPTPRIGDFVVEPILHNMLKYQAGVWDTFIGRSCSIKCVVLEGDEPLTYVWSADNGTLTADGAVATWEAPQRAGPATITVAVTDGHGDTNSTQLLMFVEDCTCKFQ